MSNTIQPVILLGAARSGTKFLRDTLRASRDLTAVPYDIPYVWRFGNEHWPNDVLPESRCPDATRRYIRKFVLSHGSGSGFVVEKTVANTLRVPFVQKVFPDAKYVHLVRDGRDVVESAYRQWQSPVDWAYTLKKAREFPWRNFRYAWWYMTNVLSGLKADASVWGPRYTGIEVDVGNRPLIEICARQWQECVESAMRDLESLATEKVMTVRYESLVREEREWISLCGFIGIRDVDAVLHQWRNSLVPDTIGKWSAGIDDKLAKKMLAVISPTLRKLKYSD